MLRTAEGEARVGLAPGIVIRGLSDTQLHALELCESQGSIGRSRQALLAEVLEQLKENRLVDAMSPGAESVMVNDAGPVGTWIARVFISLGWNVTLDDPRDAASAPRGTYAPHHAATRQGAAQVTLMQESPASGAELRLAHGPQGTAVLVNHGMLALDAHIPLMASDTPHIFVTTDESGVTVGPYVVPGLSACGTCWELTRNAGRADAIACAVQLLGPARRVPYAHPAHAAMAAGLLGSIAMRWGSYPATLANTMWRIDDAGVTSSAIAPHPQCGCGALGSVGDELAARRAAFP